MPVNSLAVHLTITISAYTSIVDDMEVGDIIILWRYHYGRFDTGAPRWWSSVAPAIKMRPYPDKRFRARYRPALATFEKPS